MNAAADLHVIAVLLAVRTPL